MKYVVFGRFLRFLSIHFAPKVTSIEFAEISGNRRKSTFPVSGSEESSPPEPEKPEKSRNKCGEGSLPLEQGEIAFWGRNNALISFNLKIANTGIAPSPLLQRRFRGFSSVFIGFPGFWDFGPPKSGKNS